MRTDLGTPRARVAPAIALLALSTLCCVGAPPAAPPTPYEAAQHASPYYVSLDPEARRRLLDVAVDFAARRDTSTPDRGACGSGIRAMQQALEHGRCETLPVDPERPRHTEIACEGAEFAELISDEAWSVRRAEVRTRYVPWVLERVAATGRGGDPAAGGAP